MSKMNGERMQLKHRTQVSIFHTLMLRNVITNDADLLILRKEIFKMIDRIKVTIRIIETIKNM